MLVCLCCVVTSDEVERAIDQGATTLEDIGKRCNAGIHCGGCHSTMIDLLHNRRPVQKSLYTMHDGTDDND